MIHSAAIQDDKYFSAHIGNARHVAHNEVVQRRMTELVELYGIVEIDVSGRIHRITVNADIFESGHQLIVNALVGRVRKMRHLII